eukprot:g76312.t1
MYTTTIGSNITAKKVGSKSYGTSRAGLSLSDSAVPLTRILLNGPECCIHPVKCSPFFFNVHMWKTKRRNYNYLGSE